MYGNRYKKNIKMWFRKNYHLTHDLCSLSPKDDLDLFVIWKLLTDSVDWCKELTGEKADDRPLIFPGCVYSMISFIMKDITMEIKLKFSKSNPFKIK